MGVGRAPTKVELRTRPYKLKIGPGNEARAFHLHFMFKRSYHFIDT
jgi:hypothetical protein